MPAAEKTWPIDELIDAVRAHAAATRDRVTLEYVAIAGVNCGADDAAALCELLRGIPVRLNLIDVNDATGRFAPPSDDERRAFIDALQPLGAPSSAATRAEKTSTPHAECSPLQPDPARARRRLLAGREEAAAAARYVDGGRDLRAGQVDARRRARHRQDPVVRRGDARP